MSSDRRWGILCAVWWTRKGALSERRDGIEANGSAALEAALEELPSFFKARGRASHGEQYIDRDGHFRSVCASMELTLSKPAFESTQDSFHAAHVLASPAQQRNCLDVLPVSLPDGNTWSVMHQGGLSK